MYLNYQSLHASPEIEARSSTVGESVASYQGFLSMTEVEADVKTTLGVVQLTSPANTNLRYHLSQAGKEARNRRIVGVTYQRSA